MILKENSISITTENIYYYPSKNLTFPNFQRGYSWKQEQVTEILNEILELANMPLSVRILEKSYLLDFIEFNEHGIVKIADGQQRIITLNILYCCINDYIVEKHLSIPLLETFSFKYDIDEYNLKCKSFFVDKKRMTSPYSSMYKTLMSFVKENALILEDIIDVLKNYTYVYVKHTDSADTAYGLFNQINSGGKALSKYDIINSTLMQYSKKYGISIPLGKTDLKDISNLVFTYYKLKMDIKSSNFSNLAVLSFINRYIVRDKVSFKKFIDYVNLVVSLKELPIYYVIKYIDKLQLLSVFYALGIKGYDIQKKRDYLEKVLLPLCLLCVVWKIKKANPGGIINSLFRDILKAINADESVENIHSIILNFVIANDGVCTILRNDFSVGLNSLDLNTIKALYIMDVILHNTSGSLNVSSVDIEHIYPQNPCNDWLANGWPGQSEAMDMLIKDIGNYMLLCESVNKKIQNKYITDKVVEYNRIISNDMVLQTPLNTVDFSAFEKEKGEYIKKRHEAIVTEIMTNFKCGPLLIVDKK